MYDIRIEPYNAVYVRFVADSDVLKVASNAFKFRIKNAHFHPKVKAKMWDGYIKLLNARTGLIYFGLLDEIIDFAKNYDYTIKINDVLLKDEKIDPKLLEKWISNLNLPENIVPRHYQIEALSDVINNRRRLIISPTGSGKSLIAYMICRWFNKKVLLIVPSLNLISQMKSDFINDYGYDPKNIHVIHAGQEKYSDCHVTISTWQSLYKMPEEYFNQFEAVIADEVHGFSSKELVGMMEKHTSVFNRIGMTGSLDDCETNEMILVGLFGAKTITKTTKQLIDEGVLTKPLIYVINVNYQKGKRPRADSEFEIEKTFLCKNESRNNYITRLIKTLKGNTLVLFNYVDSHGKILYRIGKEYIPEDKIHLIYGKVDKEDREKIRKIVMASTDNVIYASYKTLSTGVNIPNLHNIIFASPSRSTIRIVQSIGRGLRRHDSKDIVKIFDFADVLKHSRSQMLDRLAIYEKQEYEYKFIKVDL